MSRTESPNPFPDQDRSAMRTLVNKIVARPASASTRLENREVPAGHVRSRGVKILLAVRQARRR